MTDHPQTATERFLRHGVAGGYTINGHVPFFDEEQGFGYETPCEIEGTMFIRILVAELMLQPALWRCAGKALGWDNDDSYWPKCPHEWRHSVLGTPQGPRLPYDCHGISTCNVCGVQSLYFPDGKVIVVQPESGLPFRVDDTINYNRRRGWRYYQHGLLDHLAAHPGDVEGYLEKIIGGKETE